MRFACVTLLLLLAWASNAGAATWQGSFNSSYQAAQPGDTVVVPAGTYPGETVSGTKSPAVTFTMGGPVTVNGTLRVEADGLNLMGGKQLAVVYLTVFGGRNIVADGIDGTHFDIFDTPGPITVSNGDWGPCQAPRDDASCLSRVGSGSNVTIVGNSFHNITSTDLANYHVDGMAIFGGANNRVLRNRYFGNMITNIRVQTCCGNPQIANLLVEGNSFQAAINGQGGKNANGIDIDTTVPGLKIRFNSFEQGTYIQNTAPSNNAEYTGNLYTHVSCLAGVTYAYNVFVPYSEGQGQNGCSSTDTKAVSLGYDVFPGLLTTAAAINKGGPSCPSVDLNGNARPVGGACDAGAVELGGGVPPPPKCPGENGGLALTKLSETNSTITFAWAAPPGLIGYRFSSSAKPGYYSVTWDPLRSSVKFSKGPAGTCYYVGSLLAGPTGGTGG